MSEAIFAALCMAYGALVVWVTVRIINRRERWAKWAAVGLVVLAIYPLGVGPLDWFQQRGLLPRPIAAAIKCFYTPLEWLIRITPEPVAAPYRQFNFWCATRFPDTLKPQQHDVPADDP
jgi:hypothetical protein